MNQLIRKLSPLALVSLAFAAILALSPSANAQSTTQVQIKSGTNPNLALSSKTLGLVKDNNNDFAQKWDRDAVTSSTFKLAKAGTLSCLRIAAGAPNDNLAGVVLGSCNGARAQWKRVGSPGLGDLLVNVETNHALIPDFCFGVCSNHAFGFPRAQIDLLEANQKNWSFELL